MKIEASNTKITVSKITKEPVKIEASTPNRVISKIVKESVKKDIKRPYVLVIFKGNDLKFPGNINCFKSNVLKILKFNDVKKLVEAEKMYKKQGLNVKKGIEKKGKLIERKCFKNL